jgi:hypothetical protein
MVKTSDIGIPRARIGNTSATRSEFTAEKSINAIPYTRYGIIDRLNGEIEVHVDVFERGASEMKYKSQWFLECQPTHAKF